MADMSMLRPGAPPAGGGGAGPPVRGGPPTAGAGAIPPGGGQPGMNMGGLEAVRQIVKILLDKGMSVEQIIEAILNMMEMNPDMPEISEDQVRQVVTQAAGEGGGGAPAGGPPPGAAPGMGMLQQ